MKNQISGARASLRVAQNGSRKVRLVGRSAAFEKLMRSLLAHTLARSLLAGEQTAESMIERANRTLGRPWNWLPPLVRRLLRQREGSTRPRLRELARLISEDPVFQGARKRHKHRLRLAHWVTPVPVMMPAAPAADWNVPALTTTGELAEWLGLRTAAVDWLADLRGWTAADSNPGLGHYHYRILAKKPGGIRLLEAPKSRLKSVQRRILTEILERVPPHSCAHGFVKGRIVKTFLGPHAGKRVLLRMDLHNFFPSFHAGRIEAWFRMLGYPETVADVLAALCTTVTPNRVWLHPEAAATGPGERFEAQSLYRQPHLPQGAPTSPALANICSFRMDCRLAGLAEAAGANYTRYADDLAFSGDVAFDRGVERFSLHVAAVLLEEGFRVHHRKTRIMRQGVRQHIAGLVMNQKLNLMRPDFDLLKATLTNCVRMGPLSQNRNQHPDFRAHLEGRVAYAAQVNPQRAARLRSMLSRIDWEA